MASKRVNVLLPQLLKLLPSVNVRDTSHHVNERIENDYDILMRSRKVIKANII